MTAPRSSPAATPSSPATKPPSTPEATPPPSPPGRREVTAQRAAALARQARRQASGTPLTEQRIQQIIQALGDIRDVIQNADPATKARIYSRLELRLTYQPAQHRVQAQANLNPWERGDMGSVRGARTPKSQYCLAGEFAIRSLA